MNAGDDLFALVWDMLIGRADGPFTFRLIVQPSVAAFFAIRAGLRDARENQTPYLWAIFSDPEGRRDLIRRGWKDVGRIFVVAIVLDVAYELVVFRWVYPVQALLVATALSILPYLLIRGPVTRIARRSRRP